MLTNVTYVAGAKKGEGKREKGKGFLRTRTNMTGSVMGKGKGREMGSLAPEFRRL